VPGHRGIEGNEIANQLARKGSQHPFIGPEPVNSVLEREAMWAVRNGINIMLEVHTWTKELCSVSFKNHWN
jgi:hypothetical protein